jgi:hypothetical protein
MRKIYNQQHPLLCLQMLTFRNNHREPEHNIYTQSKTQENTEPMQS